MSTLQEQAAASAAERRGLGVMKRFGLAMGGLCILFCWAIPALASSIVVGQPADPGSGNCFPFGCGYSGEYQQVYTHSLFSGPVTITGLEFFNTQADTPTTSMNFGTWDISLSTTSADWNTLSPTFANNIGANNTTVFNGNLAQPWAFGDTLTIHFANPFTYNPADGNLLMDVVSGASDAGGLIFFDTNGVNGGADNGNTIFGRAFIPLFSSTPEAEHGYGLVTGFLTASTSVPEPGDLRLFGLGVLLAGAFVGLRRRTS